MGNVSKTCYVDLSYPESETYIRVSLLPLCASETNLYFLFYYFVPLHHLSLRNISENTFLTKVFFTAGRLIGRRLAVSKQLFQESGPRFLENFWNRSHSSQAECDVVLTLPSSTDRILIEWLLNTFQKRLPQLKVHLTHHRFSKFIMLICTADMPE